jgi:TM2 domain-containing membrane protein YozV
MLEEKNPVLAAVLGFCFGGLGLFYISVAQGFVALGVLITLGVCTGGVGVPFLWVGCAVWGYIAATSHNEQVRVLRADFDAPAQDFRGHYPAQLPREASRQTTPSGFTGGYQPAPVPKQLPQRASFCAECGTPVRGKGKFCTECGSSI